MGRRINISQPTVINTELVPLTDSFELVPNGQTEQWYYENDGTYAPDRRIIPLVIVPQLSAYDPDTGTTYTPSIYTISWRVATWVTNKWVDTEITNIADATQDFLILQDKSLQVRKNTKDAAHGMTIKCTATFIDPRDAGITYTEEGSIQLTANKDATIIYPQVQILNESAVAFNPLSGESSQKVFKGKASWTSTSHTSSGIASYPVDIDGTEQVLPDNADDVTTLSPVMDIMYGRGGELLRDQRFSFRRVADGELSTIPDGVATIQSIKGQTVVWNQFANKKKATNCTYTENNGVFSITPTATGSACSWYLLASPYIPLGHKVLLSYVVSGPFGKGSIAQQTTSGTFVGSAETGMPDITTTPTRVSVIKTVGAVSGDNSRLTSQGIGFYASAAQVTSTDNFVIKDIVAFDLTLMFGYGNEPSTVAEFEEWLEANVGLKDYYPYSAPRLLNVTCTGIKTVGFNQWDEEWEKGSISGADGAEAINNNAIRSKNYVRVFPSTTYYAKGPIAVMFYGADNTSSYISYVSTGNHTFTTPQECHYIRFATTGASNYGGTYNHDICINISDASKNGTYEPYKPYTLPMLGEIDISSSSSTAVFGNGMSGLPNFYDEILLENGVLTAKWNISMNPKQMSNISWQYDETLQEFYYGSPVFVGDFVQYAMCSTKYAMALDTTQDKVCYARMDNETGIFCRYCIKDSSYNSAQSFNASLTQSDYFVEALDYTRTEVLQASTQTTFEWQGVKDGVEVPIDQLPCYVSGQGTDTLTIDAMYGEEIPIILRAKRYQFTSTLFPSKAHSNLTWRIPNIDAIVKSDRGQAVHSGFDGGYDFDSIVNVRKAVLSDETKSQHLRFKWVMRNTRNNQEVETQVGFGQHISISVEDLRNVRGANNSLASTPVYNEVYLLGAYEELTYDGDSVVDSNGTKVFGRLLD